MIASRLRWASPFDQNLESSALSKRNDMCCTSFLRHWCRRRRCYNGQRFPFLFSRVSRNFFSVLWIFSHIFLSRFVFFVAGVLNFPTNAFTFVTLPNGHQTFLKLVISLFRKRKAGCAHTQAKKIAAISKDHTFMWFCGIIFLFWG